MQDRRLGFAAKEQLISLSVDISGKLYLVYGSSISGLYFSIFNGLQWLICQISKRFILMLLLLGKMLRLFCWKTTTLNLGAKSEEVFLLGIHSTISLPRGWLQ